MTLPPASTPCGRRRGSLSMAPAVGAAERPTLVALGGPTGSGKSALAAALAAELPGARILPLDTFYRDLAALPMAGRGQSNFDTPGAIDTQLLRQQLDLLRQGVPAYVPEYSFALHARTGAWWSLPPPRYLIVEGLFALYWPWLRAASALRVYVDAPDAVCLERRLARDVAGRGRERDEVLAQFHTQAAPMGTRYVRPTRHLADRVVDGRRPLTVTTAAIRQALAAAAG